MTRFVSCLILSAALLFVSHSVQAQSYTTAKEVLNASIEATGGKDAWSAVKDIHLLQEAVMEIPQGVVVIETELWALPPEVFHSRVELTDGPPEFPATMVNARMYVTADGGWSENSQGRQELTESLESMRANLMQSATNSEMNYLEMADSLVTMLENGDVDGKPAYVIQVQLPTGNGNMIKLYYDQSTLLQSAQSMAIPGMGETLVRISDYRDVAGVKFPHTQIVDLMGMGSQTISITKLEINSGLTAEKIAEIAGATQE